MKHSKTSSALLSWQTHACWKLAPQHSIFKRGTVLPFNPRKQRSMLTTALNSRARIRWPGRAGLGLGRASPVGQIHHAGNGVFLTVYLYVSYVSTQFDGGNGGRFTPGNSTWFARLVCRYVGMISPDITISNHRLCWAGDGMRFTAPLLQRKFYIYSDGTQTQVDNTNLAHETQMAENGCKWLRTWCLRYVFFDDLGHFQCAKTNHTLNLQKI